MTETEAEVFMETCVEKYGLTARGLQLHYNIAMDEYLDAVHDTLPYEKLQYDSELVTMLRSMRCNKWIFTNAHAKHLRRVMAQLGIDGCFDGILDIYDLNFQAKPAEAAYRLAMERAHVTDGTQCVFVDDRPGNLAAAKQFGWVTVLVGTTAAHAGADYCIAEVHELPQVLPDLWDA